MQETLETWVLSLGWDDPLEKSMATHSSILAWRIPWTEEPGGLQSMGSQRVGLDWSDLARACTHGQPTLGLMVGDWSYRTATGQAGSLLEEEASRLMAG